ncbi:MAG TPA: HAMP domain-containing protein [Polyangiaceae bacterium]|jgi:two-component system chemotaxis sensor kinase CheA
MSVQGGLLASIRWKAVGIVFGLTAVVVTVLATYFPARHIESLRAAIRGKAATYAVLVAKQVEPGVAFDDRETVREVFTATTEDPDVRAMVLYDAAGQPLFALGELTGRVVFSRKPLDRVTIAEGPSFFRAMAPVVSREGPTGTLVIEVSTARAEADVSGIRRTALWVGLGALGIGLAAALAIGRSIGRRLGAIAAATRAVAGGDLSVDALTDASADEVGQLARSFNTMFANIRALVEQIRESNARETGRLDSLVRVRTRELDVRNSDMRMVLDNVNQGLLVVDRRGHIAPERSAVVDQWFGQPAPEVTFPDYIERVDARAAASFRLNWSELLEGVMPVELLVDQLPRVMTAENREYELEYTPLYEGPEVARVLVVISDVTRRRAAERAEFEQSEVVRAFGHIMRDKTGFLEFVSDARLLVERLCGEERAPLVDVKRWLHTLKGNALLCGLTDLASFCHHLEDNLADSGADLTEEERHTLRSRWDAFCARFEQLLGDRADNRMPIDDADYRALLDAIVDGHPRREIASMVAAWKLESTSERFARHAAHAEALGQRLGKGPIEVSIDADRLRLPREVLAPFWSAFGHAVRNAIAHGIESPEERQAAGKPSAGHLRMSARRANDEIDIEISDDGRGIDWAAVARKASMAGLPCATDGDLHAALFADGLSTRDETDDVAGRGVGMGALRAECEKLRGEVSLVSRPGCGTTLRFSIPTQILGIETETLGARLGPVRPGPGSIGPIDGSGGSEERGIIKTMVPV